MEKVRASIILRKTAVKSNRSLYESTVEKETANELKKISLLQEKRKERDQGMIKRLQGECVHMNDSTNIAGLTSDSEHLRELQTQISQEKKSKAAKKNSADKIEIMRSIAQDRMQEQKVCSSSRHDENVFFYLKYDSKINLMVLGA